MPLFQFQVGQISLVANGCVQEVSEKGLAINFAGLFDLHGIIVKVKIEFSTYAYSK